MTVDGMLALHTLRPGTPGTPLVLLHGFPLDHRMWLDVVDLLTGDPTVLAPDLPGFGSSPVGEDVAEHVGGGTEPSIEVMADGVAATLHAAGVERAVVGGLSMGGYVAMALAERHPELVGGLALLDTKSVADTDEARANRLRIADAVLEADDVEEVVPMRSSLLGATSQQTREDLAGHLEAWIRDQGARGVAWAQRAMAARPDRTEVLRGVRVPAVVVVGEEDEISPVEQARTMAEALPDATLVVVPRSGHMTPVENPEPVAAAMSALLARAER